MAIKIAFDASHNVIPPTIVLTTRSGDRLGGLVYHNLVVKQAIRQTMELSFTVNRNDYCETNYNEELWDLISDFKLLWCKEWNCYFEINVTTNDESTLEKEVTAVSLGDAELSQINLYNIEINTEDDIARSDYEPTVLYNEENANASILHRIMEKVPHYTIKYVSPTIADIQRTFKFDNKSLYDAFQEIAEEIECIFDVVCSHGTNGIERNIYVYDIESYGDDTNILLTTDVLADNISYSVDAGSVKNCFKLEGGDDLMTATIRNCNPNGSSYIWYISDELKADMSSELVEQLEKYNEQYDYFYKYYNPFDTEIQNYSGRMLVSRLLQDYEYGGNVDLLNRPIVPISNLKNEGWDVEVYDNNNAENVTTVYAITYTNEDKTIAVNFTPIVANTSGGYVRTLPPHELNEYAKNVISGEIEDSSGLKIQIGSFFYGSNAELKAINAASRISELQEYYFISDDSNEFVDPDIISEYNSVIASNINVIKKYNKLIKKYKEYTDKFSELKTPMNGYPAIMEAYYDTTDFSYYLDNSLMPNVSMANTTAKTEASKLSYQSLKNTAVQNLSSSTSVATVNSAIIAMAKAIVDTRYQVKVLDDDCSFNYSSSANKNSTWKGKIKVTNYYDEEDSYTITLNSIPISSDYTNFLRQKMEIALADSRGSTVADIADVFALTDNESNNTAFKAELKKYSLQRLKAFHEACQSCIDILIQQGIADSNSQMYNSMYLPYYIKLGSIESEMDLRQKEIEIITGKFDSDGGLLAEGAQTILEKERNAIQDNLNFQNYLGSLLWQEFVAYRREDTYTNENYISDGLGNDELFSRAMEFIQTAQNEIEKSATKQHTISAKLKNLLVMEGFSPIVNSFEVGNWLRLKVDNKLFKLRLVDYQIDFENLESLDITFSDIVTDSIGNTAKDILNQAASMATSYNTVSRQALKGDQSSALLKNWVNDGLSLTTTKIIDNADNQEVSWDKHGLVCREYDSISDSYSDTQLKLINKGVYITDNNWRTAKAGIGNFTFFNPSANNGEGEYQNAYGVIADTLVGNLILGQSVGIYNTKNSITMDENGFMLTTNGTSNGEPQSVFTIRRKTVNNGIKSFKNMFYIDDSGYVTINGGIKIDIDGQNDNSTMIEMVDGRIITHITDELEDGGLIGSSITQTAREIKSTVAEATSKYDESGYDITLRDYGQPNNEIYPPKNYKNKLYLDQETGDVYKSSGTVWNRHKDSNGNNVTLPLISSQLYSTISQTAEAIRSEVVDTASELSSSISQTASNISSTVQATSGWDLSGLSYTIDIIGIIDGVLVSNQSYYTINGYTASNYKNKYYLDDLTGHVYQSRSSSGNYYWYREASLSRIQKSLYSHVDQTATQIRTEVSETYETKSDASTMQTFLSSSITQAAKEIKSTVAEATSKYDETGYTINIRDYGSPSDTVYPHANYVNKLYLDQETGYVYKASSSSWSNHKDSNNQKVKLPLITDKLSASIEIKAGEILSTVEDTYETTENAGKRQTALQSSIDQTASNVASTVKATSGWDIASLSYTINIIGTTAGTQVSGQSYYTISGYAADSYKGKYYLDDINGKVYHSESVSGTYRWVLKATLTRANSSIYSRIDQTAQSITNSVSATYETKSDASAMKTDLESSISQTAGQIKSTVSKAVSKYDTSGYTITLYGYGTPNDNSYAASSYSGKYYLNQNNGKLYLSDGSSWSNTKTLSLITDKLSTQISQTDSEIRSDVSATYETKTDANTKKTNLESTISQTATQIKSTVSSAVSKYDTSGYAVELYGYGAPTNNGYTASNYNNKYYLDQENGKLYLSNGSSWSNVKTLSLITDNLSSQITQTDNQIRSDVSSTYETKSDANTKKTNLESSISQTAKEIKSTVSETYETKTDANTKKTNLESSISQTAAQIRSTVSSAVSKYDTTNYTITISGYGAPTTSPNSFAASSYTGKYYLDQNNGKLYLSNGSSWSNPITLELITKNLQTQISQNATDITSKVSSGDVHTIIQQTPEDVRIAWNSISNYISFENAAIKIKNSSNNLLMQLDKSGMNLYDSSAVLLSKLDNNGISLYESGGDSGNRLTMRMNRNGAAYYWEGTNTGRIGTSGMDGMRGIVFQLENSGQYMAWSWKETANAVAYTHKFTYYPATITGTSGTTYTKGFYFADDVYLHSGCKATFNGAAEFNDPVTIKDTSTFSAAATFNNPVTLVSTSTHNGKATFNGVSVFNSNVQFNDNELQFGTTSNYSYIGNGGGSEFIVSSRSDKPLLLYGYNSKSIRIDSSGVKIDTDVSVTGTVTSSSDARIKANIKDSNVDALSLLSNIDIKEFDWLTDSTHSSAGIIAQQLQKVVPELVLEDKNTGMYSIKIDRFIPFIVKAIQELNKKITIRT